MIDVALFIPCYVDQFYPRVGLATLELLERLGVRVDFPEAQTCCGQPMANSGCFDDAAPLAEKFLSIFSPYQYVVCPSGSCTSMVRNHYATLLPKRPEVAAMRGKVYELCEFISDILHVTPSGRFPHRVGLHQSCHGLRELRLRRPDVELHLVQPESQAPALVGPSMGFEASRAALRYGFTSVTEWLTGAGATFAARFR